MPRATPLLLAVALLLSSSALAQPSLDDMIGMLTTIDDRQKNSGDYKALIYMEQSERGKDTLGYQMVTYRRDAEDKLMLLFLKPKPEAGKGYLRLNKNLFMYDPTTGKWERRTERERIGGTNSRRSDFDDSQLATHYVPSYDSAGSLGKLKTDILKLTARPDADVSSPKLKLWIDQKTGNLLKQEEYALSGRLLRTAYYPKWHKLHSPSKGTDIYFPKKILIFDEIEKGTKTEIRIDKVDLSTLPTNMFTKAWLEGKSR
jgi:outer membrane lipoprotein-sorting protein